MRHLWLASGSPRRLELLASVGVSVQRLRPPDLDESPLAGEMPEDYVSRLAQAKALAGWRQLTIDQQAKAAVLGADTTVVLDGDVLGKPDTHSAARQMLQRLSGREHRVLSAVSLTTATFTETRVSSSLVTMLVLDDALIDRYIATGEPFDKAGGYGIQGAAALFIESLKGSYSGVVGLPLRETGELLALAGVPFWQTLSEQTP